MGQASQVPAAAQAAAAAAPAAGTSSSAAGVTGSTEEEQAATDIQRNARGKSGRRAYTADVRQRQMAAAVIQTHVQKRRAILAPPSLKIARAYADSLLPRDANGNLYTVCGRVGWDVYDQLGINVGLYMRFLWWGLQLSGACTALAVVPIVLNVQGNGEWLAAANVQFTYHTLGNAPRLHWLHGAADCATSLLLLIGLIYKQRQFRQRAARQQQRKQSAADAGSLLSVTDFTLQVEGLPRSTELRGAELRAFFEQWGEVVAVSVSRAQRTPLHAAPTPGQPSPRASGPGSSRRGGGGARTPTRPCVRGQARYWCCFTGAT